MNPPLASFRAPWGRTLKVISAVMTLVFVAVVPWGLCSAPGHLTWLMLLLLLLPPVCALFMVRGYDITPDEILVRRPFWTTRVTRHNLVSAQANPEALRQCLRICGNGGVYSFTGWYWSRSLGRFTAYVNDPSRAVVLRFADRTTVVSPDNPAAFLQALGPLP